jgi:hypothetical protein
MLRIAGGWIIIFIDRTAVWTIWPRQRSRRCVLRKAPLRSAFLKTRRNVVMYSHNYWYRKQGQTNRIETVVHPSKYGPAKIFSTTLKQLPFDIS